MSTEIRSAADLDETAERGGARATTRSRIGRVTIASLAAGTVGLLGLTLVVFPGATEAVITGSMLLASGLGWASLRVLSTRTSQPQRWSSVPAVAMTMTGLGILVLQPGTSALSALTWVWPFLMLVLVVWMSRRVRRETSGYGRWLLAAVVAVLALTSLGATYENIAAAHDSRSHPAPGRLVEVNGHRLHLDCHGHGAPTVVLFNGLGEVSASWAWITSAVAPTTRVCAYDRAGQGWSEDAQHPQDALEAAGDLHALLSAAGEQGPYVLVGHSIGGPFAMTYASRYASQVAGVVLLDSSSPEQFTRMPAYPAQYEWAIRRGYAMMPTLYRLGFGRLLDTAAPSHLPADAAGRVRAVTTTARGARNARDDASMLHQVFGEAQALKTLEGRPLTVLTASASFEDTEGWPAAQDALAALSDNAVHRVVTSSHEGLLLDRGPAAESADAITDVVTTVRTR